MMSFVRCAVRGHVNVEGADQHLARIGDRLAGALETVRDPGQCIALGRIQVRQKDRPRKAGEEFAVRAQDASHPGDAAPHVDEPVEDVPLSPKRGVVELVDLGLELLGRSEEGVDVPVEQRHEELNGGQTPDRPVIPDRLSMFLEERHRPRVMRDDPFITDEDLDGRGFLVGSVGQDPDHDLERALEDRRVRPLRPGLEGGDRPVAQAQCPSNGRELGRVERRRVDPEKLVLGDTDGVPALELDSNRRSHRCGRGRLRCSPSKPMQPACRKGGTHRRGRNRRRPGSR